MASTAELRARDTVIANKLDETIEGQKTLMDQHIHVQVMYRLLNTAGILFVGPPSRPGID